MTRLSKCPTCGSERYMAHIRNGKVYTTSNNKAMKNSGFRICPKINGCGTVFDEEDHIYYQNLLDMKVNMIKAIKSAFDEKKIEEIDVLAEVIEVQEVKDLSFIRVITDLQGIMTGIVDSHFQQAIIQADV